MEKRDAFRMAQLAMLGLALWLGLTGVAMAQQPAMTPQGIPYLSGGVGDEERQAMDALAGQYNLKLEFARNDGTFLADVRVALRGPVTVDLVSEGPVLMLRLPPGTYAVTAVVEGVTKTSKVVVKNAGMQFAALFW